MLSRTVYTCKRLLVQKACQPMPTRHFFHGLHSHLIVIYRHIYLLINRCQLMLSRCHLIMLCLCRNSKHPKLVINIIHIGSYSLSDRTEIMILKLLSLWWHCSKKSPSCIYQILSLQILFPVNNEILLLRTYRRYYSLSCSITKKSEYSKSLGIYSLHRTKQRCLFIKCLTPVRTKCCGNI